MKPVCFALHGGCDSPKTWIIKTLNYGVIEINIDIDMQWEFREGVVVFYKQNEAFLQSQLGNSE